MGGLNPRRRNELVTTKTLDMLIAPAASIGFNSNPQSGYSTPAATGIRTTL